MDAALFLRIPNHNTDGIVRNGQQYDLILAVNGYRTIPEYLRILCPQGNYVVAGGSMFQLIQAGSTKKMFSKTGTQKISIASLAPSQKDLIIVKKLLETGKITPVIDGCYPLSRTPEPGGILRKNIPEEKSLSVSIDHLNLNLRENDGIRT